jgi:hypothetical protein
MINNIGGNAADVEMKDESKARIDEGELIEVIKKNKKGGRRDSKSGNAGTRPAEDRCAGI